jgi:hypothetical protein
MVLEGPMIADPGSGGSLFDYQSAAQWFPFRISKTDRGSLLFAKDANQHRVECCYLEEWAQAVNEQSAYR